ncbi:P-loop containing nucleoside triphosphate hydrolase protein [Lyophyllum atratum]|nr:P-loop containing nucleoside triphosphate hydrolase protein [Lyophyllum atratum]
MGKSHRGKKAKRMPVGTQDVAILDGSERDIVILVMGEIGAGKSTFINSLLGNARMEVGHRLTSCTSRLQFSVVESVESPHPALKGYRVIIVDTPGFSDTYEGDAEILRRIVAWLKESKAVLGGVIYLHDISCTRASLGTARRNLEMFKHLCGEAALSKVVLGTTKWARVPQSDGEGREDELEAIHWKPMLDKGSKMCRFKDTRESAMEFINTILRNKVLDSIHQIEMELAVDREIIPQTNAGTDLRHTLQQVLEMQKQMVGDEEPLTRVGNPEAQARFNEARRTMEGLADDVKVSKTPWVRRILIWLGF